MLTSGAFGYLFDYILWWMLYLSLIAHTWCFFRFFPWRRFTKVGLVLGNSLVVACLFGFAAIAGESYLRFSAVETDAFGTSLPARRWFVLYTKLNSSGCRDREWTVEKPPGVRRIAFVGDSFTYGWGIERPEDRFSDRIQAMFDHLRPGDVEVMNVAMAGWNTGQQVRAIKRIGPLYKTDEVVLCHVINDIEDLLPTTDEFNPTRPPEPMFFNMDSSCLLDYLHRRIVVPRTASVRGYFDWLSDGYENSATWLQQAKRLRTIIQYCAERQITVRVVLLPLLHVQGTKLRQEALHAKLAQFFESQGVAAVDLLPVVRSVPLSSLMVNSRDPHPNETAHAAFAEEIWKRSYAPEQEPAGDASPVDGK